MDIKQLRGKLAVAGAALLLLTGCAATRQEPTIISALPEPAVCPTCPAQPPGVVEFVWEEPMVDVVDVPPGLDPEGIYYRPAHQEVVEIRQGRWKYYKQP